MQTLHLLKSGNVVLDALGGGSVIVGPERALEYWTVTRIAVQCASANQTACAIYRDVISTQTQLFGSSAGNQDVATGTPPLEIAPSSRIIILWSGGTPGAVATAVLEGKLRR